MKGHLQNDGYRLAYESVGTGRRIIWVDPALGSSAMRPMEAAVDVLGQRFEVITYDRRGRGRNEPTADMSVEREVGDLAALVAEVGGADAVVGFSSGGALVLHAAPHVEVSLLILLEPAIDDQPDDSGLRKRLSGALEAGDWEGAVLAFYDAIGVPDEIVQQLVSSEAWPNVIRSAPTLLTDIDLAYVSDETVAEIEIPVHVIVSAGSPKEITGMSDRLAERLKARVWREAGGWHGVEPQALGHRLEAIVNA